jgi:hypothetical protein
MQPLMAGRTKDDQVVQRIVAKVAPFRQMMYVQVFRRTAVLTAPPISFEQPFAQQIVGLGAQLQSRLLLAKWMHRALCVLLVKMAAGKTGEESLRFTL